MTIELYTVNFERRVWEKVDALPESCAIFIGASGGTILWYEIPGEDLDAGLVRGNTIYFAQKNDRYLYSYDVQERSMNVSLPCPDVNSGHPEQQWILTHGWLSSPTEFTRPEVVASEVEAAPVSQGITLIDSNNVGDGWFGVPIDNLLGADCRCFHLDCEKCQFHDQLSNHRLPYLVHIGQDGELVNFYNPLTNATSISPLKGMNLTGAVIRCSKHGWLLMSQGSWGEQVFFFNPFTDERIDLPELDSYEFEGIAFSSPPTSSDCVVLGYSVGKQDLNLAYVCRGESRWTESVVERNGTQFMRSYANPVYHQGLFYLIGGTRSLCTFDPVERDAKLLELAGNDKSTVSIQGSYLLECNGKLLSVYTDRVGEFLRIYELNREAATWEGLDDTMLFLSSASSLSTTSAGARISGLGNKVFLDRFREKDSVFYSLATRKFHSLWSRYENNDWCDTKEYMNCAWMEPNFGTHTEEELVWFNPVEEEEEEEEEEKEEEEKEEEQELASFHPAIVEE
ncbi:unnamed protein product [Linum trigynum]|uniref:KIB1-4 beta-propeller domain-containing protein n=1 Tax=Linum trigynum TaxID=586398 RepID=A0AAV2FXB6_9ROSI